MKKGKCWQCIYCEKITLKINGHLLNTVRGYCTNEHSIVNSDNWVEPITIDTVNKECKEFKPIKS